jgi:hypothetical protein
MHQSSLGVQTVQIKVIKDDEQELARRATVCGKGVAVDYSSKKNLLRASVIK